MALTDEACISANLASAQCGAGAAASARRRQQRRQCLQERRSRPSLRRSQWTKRPGSRSEACSRCIMTTHGSAIRLRLTKTPTSSTADRWCIAAAPSTRAAGQCGPQPAPRGARGQLVLRPERVPCVQGEPVHHPLRRQDALRMMLPRRLFEREGGGGGGGLGGGGGEMIFFEEKLGIICPQQRCQTPPYPR